jgi:hypothetical protein
MKPGLLVAATLTAVTVAAGCGSASSGTEASGVTKEHYVAAANRTCVESRERAEAVFERVGFTGRPSAAEAQRALRALLPVMRESFAGRAELKAPPGEEDAVAAIDSAGAQAVAAFERIATDPTKARALMSGQIPDPAIEVDRLSGEYGIDECAGVD